MKKLIDDLLDEKSQLDAKIGRLAVFIDTKAQDLVSEYHASLLDNQLYAMKEYSDVLGKRIADLENSEPKAEDSELKESY